MPVDPLATYSMFCVVAPQHLNTYVRTGCVTVSCAVDVVTVTCGYTLVYFWWGLDDGVEYGVGGGFQDR